VAPLELTLTAVATAAALALPGVFLLLRRQTLLGDALGHVVLPGIVIGALLTGSVRSPWVVVGATLAGVFAVAAVERLERSRWVRNDAALGLVYPTLFAVGVILIARAPRGLHLDADAVLLGELHLAPLRRLQWGPVDVPWSLAVMTVLLAVNALFVAAFYKELMITTFDPAHAAGQGVTPGGVHFALVTLVALTIVAAFDAAGPVLVVAFIAVPAATAHLLTDRLPWLLLLAVAVACAGAAAGVELAVGFNGNTAGAVASALGGTFLAVVLFAPRHGLTAGYRRRRRLAREFESGLLTVHLAHHEGTPEAEVECRPDRLGERLAWPDARVKRVVSAATDAGLVAADGLRLRLTDRGRDLARRLVG
jgi:manganese/zinc/iron transport system permease protein